MRRGVLFRCAVVTVVVIPTVVVLLFLYSSLTRAPHPPVPPNDSAEWERQLWADAEAKPGFERTALLDDLRAGRIRAGDSLKAVLAKHPPTQSEDFGEFSEAQCRGGCGIWLIAREDRLVYASVGLPFVRLVEYEFFDVRTAEEKAKFDKVQFEAIAARRKK
jgi:hypothetical protein